MAVKIVHVNSVIVNRVAVGEELQLPLAWNGWPEKVRVYVVSENDDVQGVHEYRLDVWFHDREELDRDHEDLEKQRITNR